MTGEKIIAAAAILAAILYLLGKARLAFRKLEQIDELLSRELERNHGSSMKDDVHGMAVALGKLQAHVDDLEHKFMAHINGKRRR